MEAMDAQLQGMLKGEEAGEAEAGEGGEGAREMHTLLQSAAQSVRAQEGAAGPASTLLHSLGVAVPREWWGKGEAERG